MTSSHHPFLTDKPSIEAWLRQNRIYSYSIENGETGLIVNSTEECINLSNQNLKFIPIQFGTVTGQFIVIWANLLSLKGCPKIVGRDFDCSTNQLTSLEFGPESVGGNYQCVNNKLASLEGLPKSKLYNLLCQGNELTSFKGVTEKISTLDASRNKINTFEYFPKVVYQKLVLDDNPIMSSINPADEDVDVLDIFMTKHKLFHEVNKVKISLETILSPSPSPMITSPSFKV